MTLQPLPTQQEGRAPTDLQLRLLTWVQRFREEKEYSPTFREVQEAFDWESSANAQQNFETLRRRGWATWERGTGRTLRPTAEGLAVLAKHKGGGQ